MHDYFSKGKLAVITGAASGIGEQFARTLHSRGMKLMLCDIEGKKLEALSEELNAHSAYCDVGSIKHLNDVAKLIMEKIDEEIGAIFANAGVMKTGKIENMSLRDWKFMIDVNIMGVANTISAFIPLLKSQLSPSRFIATASVAGLVSAPMSGAYNATKHAVVSMCETLHQELVGEHSQIGVSVICPGAVKTDILNLEKYGEVEGDVKYHDRMRQLMAERGLSTETMVTRSLEQIKQGNFWVFPQDYVFDRFRARSDAILSQSDPKWMSE